MTEPEHVPEHGRHELPDDAPRPRPRRQVAFGALAVSGTAILLALPRTASAQIGITTWSGAVASEFPITLRPGFSADSVGTKRYTFTLGQGSARITAETFSGDVSITSSGGK